MGNFDLNCENSWEIVPSEYLVRTSWSKNRRGWEIEGICISERKFLPWRWWSEGESTTLATALLISCPVSAINPPIYFDLAKLYTNVRPKDLWFQPKSPQIDPDLEYGANIWFISPNGSDRIVVLFYFLFSLLSLLPLSLSPPLPKRWVIWINRILCYYCTYLVRQLVSVNYIFNHDFKTITYFLFYYFIYVLCPRAKGGLEVRCNFLFGKKMLIKGNSLPLLHIHPLTKCKYKMSGQFHSKVIYYTMK